MTGRYQTYSQYRDSNVDWIGKVPSHWVVGRLKNVLKIKNGRDYKNVEVSSGGFPVYGSGGIFKRSSDYLYDGVSILFGRKGTIDKPLLVEGKFWTVDTMFFSELNSKYNVKFIYNQTKLFPYNLLSTSTALPSMTQEDLLNLPFVLPPHNEQQSIADFLDYEVAKIDLLIGKQEKLIELLKEKRQAVISHAVTKGLNPDVETKDSGVEWLGKVPTHWRIVKLSYFLKLLSGDGITSNEIEPEGKYPVMGGNGLRGFTQNYNCDGEYALIGRQGALCGNINIATGKFFASEHAVVVYPLINFDLTFLSEFLRFMNLGQYSVSAAQPGISVERINRLKIAIPPQNEQKCIGDEIKAYVYKFDTLTTKAETMIKTLKERKTALISATVTGKIDVRNWQG